MNVIYCYSYILHVEMKVSKCHNHAWYHHNMAGAAPNLWLHFNSCPFWRSQIPAPMHKWGNQGLQAWQVVSLWKNAWALVNSPYIPTLHFLFSPTMCCGAAHLWTLLNGALVWPDSSPLLHFPSNLPAQPSDCHRKAVKAFHCFCIAALFPQHCLTIAIFYHTARFVYLLCHLFFFFPLLSIH